VKDEAQLLLQGRITRTFGGGCCVDWLREVADQKRSALVLFKLGITDRPGLLRTVTGRGSFWISCLKKLEKLLRVVQMSKQRGRELLL
jgi:hypothetical protein